MMAYLDLVAMGSVPTQRLYLVRYFYALGLYVLCGALQAIAVLLELAPLDNSVLLFTFIFAGQALIYGAIRSGANLRFLDASLTLPQMLFANVAISLSYLVNPSARGMTSILMAVALVFGAFTLNPRQCRQLGWWCVATLAAAWAVSTGNLLVIQHPPIELLHVVLSSVILLLISRLTGQLSDLRVKQKVQKAQLREALEKVQLLATRDELTGLANRRHAMELLAQEERKSARQGVTPCFALIDIDFFKRINDTLGHSAGDETLRRFSGILGTSLRPGDVLARWGGEEFLLLLPSTPLADAKMVLDRLRERCSDPTNWDGLANLQVTFSAGIASHQVGESTQQAIARADAALYRAKAAGRNQVQVA